MVKAEAKLNCEMTNGSVAIDLVGAEPIRFKLGVAVRQIIDETSGLSLNFDVFGRSFAVIGRIEIWSSGFLRPLSCGSDDMPTRWFSIIRSRFGFRAFPLVDC